MQVHYKTFGCKANQYDTERMRQLIEAGAPGGGTRVRTSPLEAADLCVVNTCTVTNQADADARRFIRRVARRNPRARIVVAGCSAVLRARDYRAMDEVGEVVEGHDPSAVLAAANRALAHSGPSAAPPVYARRTRLSPSWSRIGWRTVQSASRWRSRAAMPTPSPPAKRASAALAPSLSAHR